jgi:hypothetical protein
MNGADVDVELLIVPDCRNASAARELLESALRAAELTNTHVRVSVIDSQLAAEQRRFQGSPTILIDGLDPFTEREQPPALACRIYAGGSGLPPVEQLREALANAAGKCNRPPGVERPAGPPVDRQVLGTGLGSA